MAPTKRPRRALSASSASSAGSSSSTDTSPDTKAPADWPAPAAAMAAARAFLLDCAQNSTHTLLCPDKDADGLSAGVILHRTLLALGHAPGAITVHLLAKGASPHAASERERMRAHSPRYAIFADHGSRAGAPLVDKGVRTLLLDHHLSAAFPEGTTVLSACRTPPIATSTALAYALCAPLHKSVEETCDYLCAIGTLGDLGSAHKFDAPWPDMRACFKRYTKTRVSEAVSLLNAPRRTPAYTVSDAWTALLASSSPADVVANQALRAAREQVNAEVARCARIAPRFSADGRVALVRMTSGAQVHPLVATRWANTLKGKNLELVIAANDGYLPDKVNFACRVARCYTARNAPAARAPKRARLDAWVGKASAEKGRAGADEDKASKEKGSATAEPDQAGAAMGTDPASAQGGAEADAPGAYSIPDALRAYAARDAGLSEELGEDFARGHAQASGGVVSAPAWARLWAAMDAAPPALPGGKPKATARQGRLDGWVKK